jgi:hypothetical protein
MKIAYLLLLSVTAAAGAESHGPAQHWAYQPVKRPDIPAVRRQDWARKPLDAFILSALESKGLSPSPEADRATFIRRATLDAWGVIPTPDQVRAFVNDRSPDAYEKLVDRLLASPHYGERQARRWLDLARYADSTGFENDATRPNMYRYRDYVIDAFNRDKPYNQFIREQLAGDELAPGNQESMIATGFLANYPDNHNSRDLLDRKYQIATDITDTVGAVFLAQTVGCARCHNHKFDRISQKEYFQLQAFFANISETADFPAKIGPAETGYRQQLAKWEEATKDLRAQRTALIDSFREQGTKYYHERYLVDSQKSIFKPQDQWNALDRWVNHRVSYVTSENSIAAFLADAGARRSAAEFDPKYVDMLRRYNELNAQLKKFDDLKPAKGSDTYTAMTELGRPDAPPTFVFFVGDHDRPLEEVQPGFPAAIAGGEEPVIVPGATSSGRRTALANWVASERNPLTARVFVNRVWNQYFGKGIVETVSDFGKAGAKPTNPELLDYLADRFVRDGWSIKKLHREILLSSVYRQSSDYRAELAQADPENKLLGVFPRQRLEAEEIRDSLLAAAGKLDDDTVGGPSVFPPVPNGLNPGNAWQVSKDARDFNRRSVYIFTRRAVPYPLLEAFDMASPQQVHSKRDVTTTPLQALTLYNDDQVYQWSQALAERIARETGETSGVASARLDRLYELLLSRAPDITEKQTLLSFLDSHKNETAFLDLVHTVVNSNDFAYKF